MRYNTSTNPMKRLNALEKEYREAQRAEQEWFLYNLFEQNPHTAKRVKAESAYYNALNIGPAAKMLCGA